MSSCWPGPGSPIWMLPAQAVVQADAEVEQISTEIDRAIVRSPIDGQVLQVNVRRWRARRRPGRSRR